jgi:hypothetical protein
MPFKHGGKLLNTLLVGSMLFSPSVAFFSAQGKERNIVLNRRKASISNSNQINKTTKKTFVPFFSSSKK